MALHQHHPRRFSVKFGQIVLVLLLASNTLLSTVSPARAAPRADTALTTIPVGTNPMSVAVNPVTNKVYVANNGSSTVTVIDGATNVTATVNTGLRPQAVVVNPATNKIYVSNYDDRTVTVIDGATNVTATVGTGDLPNAVVVNSVTNKVYVPNFGDNTVTVIDGATNVTSTVGAGVEPIGLALNPVTNKVYVANYRSDTVTVIDGATNVTTTLNVGITPQRVVVNPATNKVYVANSNGNIVTVIDGATNVTATLAVGVSPIFMAVNPVTNKVYVANNTGNTVTIIDGVTNSASTVAAGQSPYDIAVNPVTNKVYVTRSNGASVMVMDGATNVTSTVSTGAMPIALAVNPLTNKIYVANYSSHTVTVIDGNSYPTSTVPVAGVPSDVAVDPLTAKVWVASDNLALIDGATQITTSVSTNLLVALAVNPVTGKIYGGSTPFQTPMSVIDEASLAVTQIPGTCVFCFNLVVDPVINKVYAAPGMDEKVRVIDGATNAVTDLAVTNFTNGVAVNPATSKAYFLVGNTVVVVDGATHTILKTVAVGTNPYAIAVNPLTNRIYAANSSNNNVTVIDGATDTVVTTVPVGTYPLYIAVNPLTNRIYVANNSSNNVTVINGASNTVVATVSAGTSPIAIAIDLAANRIYVANSGTFGVNSTTTVIDGASNTRLTNVGSGVSPRRLAVNPHTQKVYVANQNSSSVTVIDPQPAWNIPLLTLSSALPGNVSSSATPTFTFNKADGISYLPITPPVQGFYYQVDTLGGAWTAATLNNGRWQGTTTSLSNGLHTLYAFASDGQEAGTGNTLVTGKVSAYTFLVRVPNTTYADVSGGCGGSTACYTGVQDAISHTLPGGAVMVYPGDYTESVSVNQNVTITFTGDVTLTALSQISGTVNAPIGTLTLNGDFAHTGGTFNANGGTIAFIGSNVTRTLTVTVPTQFYNLTVGTGITLTHSTNNDNTGVNGTLSNNGAIYKSFEFSGVSVIAKVLGGLKALAMLRVDQSHPQATPGIQTNKYWHIDAITTTTAAFDLGLTLPHNAVSDPKVCKYPGNVGGAGWDCARDDFNSTGVWRSGIAALSDWAVGNFVGPTVVQATGLEARSAPIEWPIAMGLIAALAGLSSWLIIGRRSIAHRFHND